MKKLYTKKGETMVESLVGILIAVLASACFFSACMAAMKINNAANEVERTYYEELNGIEDGTGLTSEGFINISDGAYDWNIEARYSDDTITAYAAR